MVTRAERTRLIRLGQRVGPPIREADAGNVFRDPVNHARSVIESLRLDDIPDSVDETHKKSLQQRFIDRTRTELSHLYAASLAAERPLTAGQVAVLQLKAQDDGAARVALVEAALKAGQANQRHLRWLDQAEEMQVDTAALRRRLQALE